MKLNDLLNGLLQIKIGGQEKISRASFETGSGYLLVTKIGEADFSLNPINGGKTVSLRLSDLEASDWIVVSNLNNLEKIVSNPIPKSEPITRGQPLKWDFK